MKLRTLSRESTSQGNVTGITSQLVDEGVSQCSSQGLSACRQSHYDETWHDIFGNGGHLKNTTALVFKIGFTMAISIGKMMMKP